MTCQNNILPASIWAAICLTVPNWHLDPVGILAALRATLVLGCFLVRHEPTAKAPSYQGAIAWGSALLPLLLNLNFDGSVAGRIGLSFTILGTLLVGLSCIDLGRSFGVSPAVRPYVESGIYKRVRHPMYSGHVVAELGFLLAAPTSFNFAIVLIGWSLYMLRLRWEDRLIRVSGLNKPAFIALRQLSMPRDKFSA